MNDLISRQAAIDAILGCCTSDFDNEYECGYDDGLRQGVHRLKHLSSAPPIIRCKDCEWFRKEYGWNCIEYTVCGVSPTHHPIRREDDFCSHAERRSDE